MQRSIKHTQKPIHLCTLYAIILFTVLSFQINGAVAAEEGSNTEEPHQSRVHFHGFGSLGLARSNDDNAQFVRDLSQPDGLRQGWSGKVDSQLGLQANLCIAEQTEAVMQVVSRYHADGSYNPELTWAFLRHDFTPDFTLRGGRLGTEFFMLADTRMVAYSNLTVRPPSDYFGSLIFSYIDGVDASLATPLAEGLLRGKLFVGLSPEKSPFVDDLIWDLNGSLLTGGYLDYLAGPWQLRWSHARVRFEHEQPLDALFALPNAMSYVAMVPSMSMQNQKTHFTSLGLVYDEGPLQLQWMLNQITHDSAAYENSKAGYFIAAYRLNHLTPYAGISRVYSSKKPLPSSPIPGIDALTALSQAQSHSDQHTFFMGGRWDIRQNWALKAQVDWVRGEPTSVFPFRDDRPGIWDGNMAVYSLALDFIF